jgi:hypothetical protein
VKPFALLGAALVLGACAHGTPPEVPAALAPPPGEAETMTVAAQGVQLYECRGDAWVFVAPEAVLFDGRGQRIGTHGAGPHWLADDGSRIVGRVTARADAPRDGAIPWLLLAAQPTGTPGAFSRVTSIQRIHTRGGLAPSTPCTPERAGAMARVPYAADYRFFAQR